MKSSSALLPLAIGWGLLTPASLVAGQFTVSYDLPDGAIPDGRSTGLADTRVIAATGLVITDIDVSLTLRGAGTGGGFNGDLYVTLLHNGVFTVLLNRPGRRADDPFGYDDNGLSVTLDDSASADVHSYRLSLTGDETIPLPGILSGQFQPDGRASDPAVVLASDTRAFRLEAYQGLDPAGEWTLFAADLEAGGELRLLSWGLTITTRDGTDLVIPEGSAALAIGGWLAIGAVYQWLRRHRPNACRSSTCQSGPPGS